MEEWLQCKGSSSSTRYTCLLQAVRVSVCIVDMHCLLRGMVPYPQCFSAMLTGASIPV